MSRSGRTYTPFVKLIIQLNYPASIEKLAACTFAENVMFEIRCQRALRADHL